MFCCNTKYRILSSAGVEQRTVPSWYTGRHPDSFNASISGASFGSSACVKWKASQIRAPARTNLDHPRRTLQEFGAIKGHFARRKTPFASPFER